MILSVSAKNNSFAQLSSVFHASFDHSKAKNANMKKFPFHKKGITELQHILYALPDNKLAIEVLALRTDFRGWIKTKFELKPDELDFLNDLNTHFIEYAAIKSSNFLAQRKPVRFTVVEFRPHLTETENPTQHII